MRNLFFFSISTLCLFLSACGSTQIVYQGIQHPQTSDVAVSFQEQSIPDSCFAFAHLLLHTKTDASGEDIASTMRTEAMARGANLLLVGMTREILKEELEENQFDYFGPEYSYNFNKTWLGWKFAFSEWNEGDDLLGFGTDSWGNGQTHFPHTLLIQAVFLRCGTDGYQGSVEHAQQPSN